MATLVFIGGAFRCTTLCTTVEADQVKSILDEFIDGPVMLVGHSKGDDAITFKGLHEQAIRAVYLAAHVQFNHVPNVV